MIKPSLLESKLICHKICSWYSHKVPASETSEIDRTITHSPLPDLTEGQSKKTCGFIQTQRFDILLPIWSHQLISLFCLHAEVYQKNSKRNQKNAGKPHSQSLYTSTSKNVIVISETIQQRLQGSPIDSHRNYRKLEANKVVLQVSLTLFK